MRHRQHHGARRSLATRTRREDGQALTEYVTIVGMTALTVIASMALLITPVAMAFVRLFRHMALYLTTN